MTSADLYELRRLIWRAMKRRNQIVASCIGKAHFNTPEQARRSIRHDHLHAYHCQHCRYWHVGAKKPQARVA